MIQWTKWNVSFNSHQLFYKLYTNQRDDNREMFPKIFQQKKIICIPSHVTTLSGLTVSHSREKGFFVCVIQTNSWINRYCLLYVYIHIPYIHDETETNMFSRMIEMLFMGADVKVYDFIRQLNASENHFITIVIVNLYLYLCSYRKTHSPVCII